MAKGIDWILTLRDRMSGPAGKIRRSLQSITQGLNQTKAASEALDRAMGAQVGKLTPKQRWAAGVKSQRDALAAREKSLKAQRDQLLAAGAARRKFVDDTVEDIGIAGGAIAASIGIATAVLSKLGSLGAAGAKLVLDAQAFKEGTLGAFKILLKSEQAATAAYQKALDTAAFLGTSPKQVLSSFQDLLGKGFDVGTVDRLVRAMSDLKAINPKANLDNLVLAIGQIKAKGVLQMEELQGQIAEAGLNTALVFKHLAKRLKIEGKDVTDTITKVRKAISAGKVTGDMGIEAIIDAMQEMSGGKGLGEISRARSLSTLPGILEAIRGKAEGLLLGLDVGQAFEGVKGFFRSIFEFLDGPGGQRLSKAVSTIVESIGSIFSGVFDKKTTGGALDTIVSLVEHVATVFKQSAPGITEFWKGFVAAVRQAGPILESLLGVARGLNQGVFGDTALMAKFGAALGAIITVAVIGVSAVVGLVKAFKDLGDTIGSAVAWFLTLPLAIARGLGMGQATVSGFTSSFSSAGNGLGANIMSGMTAGIWAGLSSVTSALSSVASAAVGAVTGPLQIRSPSKVFEKLGGHTTEGFARGAEQNPSPQRVLSSMMAPPSQTTASGMGAAMARASSAGAASGGGDRSVSLTVNGGINVPSGTTAEQAQSILEQVGEGVFQMAVQRGLI